MKKNVKKTAFLFGSFMTRVVLAFLFYVLSVVLLNNLFIYKLTADFQVRQFLL